MLKETNVVKFASVSDIHLFHPKTTTAQICENLRNTIFSESVLKEIDVLFIVGDLTDRSIYFNDTDVHLFTIEFTRLFILCLKYNVTIISLEGTPSHDRKQSRFLNTLRSVFEMIDSNKQVDYTHVETLDILYFKKLNKHILFVPDEFSPTPAQTLALVKQKLKDAYIEAVDVCLLHGYFDFQVPPEIKTIQAHSSEEYSKIVLGPVLSGHVHERTRYKNIEPHGSFDRIAHNEEAPKGYLRGVIFDNNSYEVSFIENKNAAIYKTLICNQTNMEDTLVYLQKTIKKYRHGSRIKIRAVSTHPIFANKKVVREMFPDHVLDFDSKKPKKQLEKIMSNTASDPCVTINKTTIKELVSKKINASDKLPHNLRDKCMTTLSTIMESIGGH